MIKNCTKTTTLFGSLHLLHMVKELPWVSLVTVQLSSLSDDDRFCTFLSFSATSRTFDIFLAWLFKICSRISLTWKWEKVHQNMKSDKAQQSSKHFEQLLLNKLSDMNQYINVVCKTARAKAATSISNQHAGSICLFRLSMSDQIYCLRFQIKHHNL